MSQASIAERIARGNFRFLILTSFLMLIAIGCEKKTKTWKDYEVTRVDRTRPLADEAETKIPRSLWEKIQGFVEKKKETGEIPIVFKPVSVYLLEKNQGILRNGSVVVEIGQAGGEIDLSDFVQARNGSFFFVVDFVPEFELANRRVYFLSNSIERTKGTDALGTGCNSYFDVTSAFNQALKSEGFLVNTFENRHVSALAGTYFFTAVHDGNLYIGSFSIKDSTRPELQCR
jgi:hypothetical protein